jgi:hypothetical protein
MKRMCALALKRLKPTLTEREVQFLVEGLAIYASCIQPEEAAAIGADLVDGDGGLPPGGLPVSSPAWLEVPLDNQDPARQPRCLSEARIGRLRALGRSVPSDLNQPRLVVK